MAHNFSAFASTAGSSYNNNMNPQKGMKVMKKRFLAMALCLCMIFALACLRRHIGFYQIRR